MGFNCGIVGLPNVGKSTLFNALTQSQAAESANFPFTTIEPNVGRVSVPDKRLDALAAIANPEKVLPTQLEFVDIAGLVKGASKGEGLGNKFLGNIREVDAIMHVLRCFDGGDVTHVNGAADPVGDAETVSTELMLADMESLAKRIDPLTKKARGQDKVAVMELALVERTLKLLESGQPARELEVNDDEAKIFHKLGLLTSKPVLYILNVDEDSAATGNALSAKATAMAADEGAGAVVISAKIEEEVAQLTDVAERAEFLESLGLEETGLDRVVRAGQDLLKLFTFFTVGPKEVRAWTIPAGATAQESAGVIHTDFARGFIAAETISYDDFIALGGEQGAKDAGKMRAEGRGYVVKDGDVMLFRFNV
ncbi:MAG: redox-regulated ATPase YchF [Rhodospirillales bacterium]|nr:redox-regulated ATPase YchF [Rhodospirillales bacterium]